MIEVNGKTYEVIEANTPHGMREAGRGNTATQMVKAKIEQMFTLKLPNGKSFYQVAQYKNGNFGKMVKVA